jgi:cytoskeleton protein RodZ
VDEIGSTLREARMRARIDITEVEAATKIRAKYLRALENEEWDLLPGPIYARSFLRTYGDYLGLDSRMLAELFKQRFERPSEHDLRPRASLARDRERRDRPSRVPSWAPIAVVVVVLVAVLWAVGSATNSSTPAPATHSARSHRVRHRHHGPVKLPATVRRPRRVTVQMVPTGPVYVCLVNAAGSKLINQQTFAVGQTIPTQTGHRLLLTLGNNAVDLKVNGRSVPVGPSSNPIRFLITPHGTSAIPLSQAPTCP